MIQMTDYGLGFRLGSFVSMEIRILPVAYESADPQPAFYPWLR